MWLLIVCKLFVSIDIILYTSSNQLTYNAAKPQKISSPDLHPLPDHKHQAFYTAFQNKYSKSIIDDE